MQGWIGPPGHSEFPGGGLYILMKRTCVLDGEKFKTPAITQFLNLINTSISIEPLSSVDVLSVQCSVS